MKFVYSSLKSKKTICISALGTIFYWLFIGRQLDLSLKATTKIIFLTKHFDYVCPAP